ncbi:MAG: class I SAM-dependent methyltransferase [Deltaproteobacteria bacterium]|nr:class I SAM-dependent methyltransferase [Deltaproteobacteria bacterium]
MELVRPVATSRSSCRLPLHNGPWQNGLPVRFVQHSSALTDSSFDLAISHDTFEHVSDPAGVLRELHRLLRPGGRAYLKFGPLWRAPLGLHMFGTIAQRRLPWLHLIFRERTVMRLWSEMAGVSPPLTQYSERPGGMNKMTVARFHALVAASL